MRLQNFGDENWGFAQLTETEVGLLQEIGSAAEPDGCEEAEGRLYQRPMADFGPDEAEFVSDWDDFVTDGFREEFKAAVAVVETDLENLLPEEILEPLDGDPSLPSVAREDAIVPDARADGDESEEDEFDDDEFDDDEFELGSEFDIAGPTFTLMVPKAHAERWFGALNQARLVLAARYRLYDSAGEPMISIRYTEEGPAILVAGEDDPDLPPVEARFDAYLKNQAYGFIQEWLIAEILSKGL